MIFLVIGEKKEYRRNQISTIMADSPQSEVLICEDIDGDISMLEHYLYPSLFTQSPPIVHLKYLLEENTSSLNAILKKMLASPTVFVFEEMSLNKSNLDLFKKSGSIIYEDEKKKKNSPADNGIFSITRALTDPSKKNRWLIYRSVLEKHPIEAVMGILYWKLKDLAGKNNKEAKRYKDLYQKMIKAHAQAWATNTSLELLIEKVILEA